MSKTNGENPLWLVHQSMNQLGSYKLSLVELECLRDLRNPDSTSCCEAGFIFKTPLLDVVFNIHTKLGVFLDEIGAFNESLLHFQKAFELCGVQTHLQTRISLAIPTVVDSQKENEKILSDLMIKIRMLSNPNANEHVLSSIGAATADNMYPWTASYLSWTITPPTMFLGYQGKDVLNIQEAITKMYYKRSLLLLDEYRGHIPEALDKIRIGFISSWFRDHSVGKLILGVVKKLDRKRFHVVVACARHFFSSFDGYSKRFKDAADLFIQLPYSFEESKAVLREQNFDIAIYPELGMDAWLMLLAHTRFAPIQAMFWGHPITTGIPSIDYFISSELYFQGNEVNSQQNNHAYNDMQYSEQIILFEGLTTSFKKPRVPKTPMTRSMLGLPENYRLYTCLQSIMKYHPSFDDVLEGILKKDSRGIIVLLYSKAQVLWKEKLSQRLQKRLSNDFYRVIFKKKMNHEMYLSMLACSSVILDPFPWGGGVSTLDALAAGRGVVTLPQKQTVIRLTSGFYKFIGIEMCTVSSVSEYIDVAVKIACNRETQEEISSLLLSRYDKLYDDKESIEEWNTVLERLHTHHQKNVEYD